jgi:rhodanese-related sulfurtransferase
MAIGYKELVARAEAKIESISVAQALPLVNDPDVVMVDLRDIREVAREGRIPGSFHAPRGMLEFWIDPESPYHNPIFASDKRFVFYCNKGWRSALAAEIAQAMGLAKVCHIAGGFSDWTEAGGPVEQLPARK